MQQQDDSRKKNKGKNERYSAAAHPKMLSLSEAKRKASKFAAKNDKSLRVGAKRAVLRELNSHLVVKAQGIFPSAQVSDNPYAAGQTAIPQTKARVKTENKVKPEVYNWAKNGRQQELRIRYIARKYLLLWIRKVYGRIHPFVARSHYQHRLKVKVIRTWQEIWWSGRKGWKLNIRAEYHYRYRTWVKIWNSWRSYVKLRRIKNKKLQRAIEHYNKSAQEKCLLAWKKYILNRKHKKAKQENALEMAFISLKRCAWLKWVKETEKRMLQREMEHTALRHWAFNVVAKSWKCWMSTWSEKQLYQKKMSFAKKRADKVLMTRVWICWKNHITVKKLKNIQKRIASRHYSISLMLKAIRLWNVRWQRNQQIAQFVDLIEHKGELARKRRILIHWKLYIILQQQQQLNKEKANIHYLRFLKKKCLHALSHYSHLQELKWSRKSESQEFWNKLLQRRVWKIWLKRCEHSEELKIYPLTRKARTLYRVSLLQKAFIKWQNYRRWRRYRKVQYSIADIHYNKIILPSYFKRMEMFVDIMKEKREMQYEADNFRREVLLSQGFYKWYRESQLAIDIKMMNRMAVLHHDGTIKQQCLKVWRQRTRSEIRQHNLEAKADYHYEQCLLIKAITSWKNFSRETAISRYYHQTAVRHYYLSLLKKIWSAWSKYIEQRETKWRKQAIADIHHQHRTLRKCLDSWKVHHKVNKTAMTIANQKFTEHQTARMRWALSAWHHFASWHENKRILNHRAKAAYQLTIVKKAFVSWRVYVCRRAIKNGEQAVLCKEKRAILDQGKLCRVFHMWKALTELSQYSKSRHQLSEQHHRKNLLTKSLSAWLQFVKLNFRIKLLNRQSQLMHNQRITTFFFRNWKRQYLISIKTKQKTSLSLWHWSVTLQRKAFAAWLQYAIDKKRKEIRIAQALDQRRTRLIKTGVTHWIEVAFHLSSLRNRYAQARHVQQAHNIHQFVYKCALHWRRWTSRRVSNKVTQQRRPTLKQPTTQSRSCARPVERGTTTPIKFPAELFKARPQPRVPDYLRESYDVSSISNETTPAIRYGKSATNDVKFTLGGSKIPTASNIAKTIPDRAATIDGEDPLNYDKAPISSRRLHPITISEDTPCPRPSPPQPCTQLLPHPRQRSFTDDSMTLSADGDWGREREAPMNYRHRSVNVKLLPPSSFQASSTDRHPKDKPIFPDKENAENHTIGTSAWKKRDIKTEIFEARKTLQEYYNLKLRYRTIKQRREDLLRKTENAKSKQEDQELLKELDVELDEVKSKIEQGSCTVELVAGNIQKLIEKVAKNNED